eukprot:CAMPEP_0185459322 /NCGR_PEP_ID=MMETSP1365-20130426/84566_1 /TAXON_ID=38817 /ORGANISM="Gephyrocapsa oceanica, Strain RCC1303" /LENGTH=59 /DNA_ID=CAMNT_0028065865 /DNA_START=1 /DNA_END=177 /DNA_ORIENTATION=+
MRSSTPRAPLELRAWAAARALMTDVHSRPVGGSSALQADPVASAVQGFTACAPRSRPTR